MTLPHDGSKSCPEASDLSAYLDGELPAAKRQALESHLSTCAACAQELDSLRAAATWFARQSPELQLNPRNIHQRTDFLNRLHAAVARQWDQLEEKLTPARSIAQLWERGWMLQFSRRLALAAACLAMAGTLWLWRGGALKRPQPMAVSTQAGVSTEIPAVPAPWETPAIFPPAAPQNDNAGGTPELASNISGNTSNDARLSEWIVDDLSRGAR